MKIKLAEALLRRKELQEKVDQLRKVKQEGMFEIKTARKAVHEGIDDVIAQVPKVGLDQVTAGYDWHSKRLRLIDAAIQQANWVTELDVDSTIMDDFVDRLATKD